MREAPTKRREAMASHCWFDWAMAVLSAWLTGGAFVDGWAHTHGQADTTFFTPWHVAFYTGFLAVAGALVEALGGFDVRTGQQRWIFHAVPQGEEPGVETWGNDSWKHTGNTNIWTVMSCDEQLGYVYLPFSTPSNDYYGGQRLGNNLFAESLVALQAETGTRVWHFQIGGAGQPAELVAPRLP